MSPLISSVSETAVTTIIRLPPSTLYLSMIVYYQLSILRSLVSRYYLLFFHLTILPQCKYDIKITTFLCLKFRDVGSFFVIRHPLTTYDVPSLLNYGRFLNFQCLIDLVFSQRDLLASRPKVSLNLFIFYYQPSILGNLILISPKSQ